MAAKAILRATCFVVLMVLGLGLAIVALVQLRHAQQPNYCRMTYMRPAYVPISLLDGDDAAGQQQSSTSPTTVDAHGKYKLYLYREAELVQSDAYSRLGVGAVLFIPGNGGSYQQVRSVATHMYKHQSRWNAMDLFAADFDEELSGFDGGLLERQTRYINRCIATIMAMYESSTSPNSPRSVILIGHSMGGMVARAVVSRADYVPGSVRTIITLNTPHQTAPLLASRSLAYFYANVNAFWREKIAAAEPGSEFADLVVASIAGGFRDTLIDSRLCSLEGLIAPSRAISVVTSGMSGIWLEADHQCILWCNQLVHVLTSALLELVEPVPPHVFVASASERHRILQRHLVSNASSVLLRNQPRAASFEPLEAGSRIVRELNAKLDGSQSHHERLLVRYGLEKPTTIVLDVASHKDASTLVVVSDAEIGQALLVYGCIRGANERAFSECQRLSHEAITSVPHNDDLVPNAQQSRDTRIPRHPRSYRTLAASHVAMADATPFDAIVLDLAAPHGRRFIAAQLLDASAFEHDGTQLHVPRSVFGSSELALDGEPAQLLRVLQLPTLDRHWPLALTLSAHNGGDHRFLPLVFWSRPRSIEQAYADHSEQAFRVNATSLLMRFHHQSAHGAALVVIADPTEQQELVIGASFDLAGAVEQYARSFAATLTVMPALMSVWLLAEQLLWLTIGFQQLRGGVGHLIARSPFVLLVGLVVVPALYWAPRWWLGSGENELPLWLGNLAIVQVSREWPSPLELGVLFVAAYPVVFLFTALAQGAPKLMAVLLRLVGWSAESVPLSAQLGILLALYGTAYVQHSFVPVALSALCCGVCCALHQAQYDRDEDHEQLYTITIVLHLHALALMAPNFIVWLQDVHTFGWSHPSDDDFRVLAIIMALLAWSVQMLRPPTKSKYYRPPTTIQQLADSVVLPLACAVTLLIACHGIAIVPPLYDLQHIVMRASLVVMAVALFQIPFRS